MISLSYPNLPAMFWARAVERADAPFLWYKINDQYKSFSWNQIADDVMAVAATLHKLGVQKGDRVVLISESRPEWLVADFAIMQLGAITVPGYTTHGVEDYRYLLDHSGAKLAIVSPSLAAKVQAASKAPVLLIDALEKGDPSNLPKVDIGLDDTACIIYTSGTEGNPKGVMLSHGALLHNCRAAYHIVKGLGIGREVFLSFLPLSHSYEHLAGHFFPVMIGAEIYYAEGADALLKNMAECRPTIMTAVPRLYEVIRSRILQQVKRGSWLSQKLFAARSVPVLNILVRRKIKQKFGGRLKAFVSGGAPLQVEVGEFFQSLGVRVLQGYGQTESAPLISCNLPGSEKIHTVGPIVPEVEVKIADDGEILARGPNLMQGYWQNPEATSKTIIDGWLHTGDIGHLDEDQHLVITDRKKEIIVVSGGDNISPQRVEGILCLEPAISQAMVYGDKKPYLTAVIVPNKDFDKLAATKAIEAANAKLSALEKVKKFIMAEDAFTIENGLLTPTLKLRRRKIKEIYGERLEGLY